MRGQQLWARIGTGIVLAGAVGLGLVAIPAGAGAAPELPPVTAEDLLASVAKADPGPLAGTVELDNNLGLPAIPGAPELSNSSQQARVWSGGDGKGRVSLPSAQGEKTLVSDGTTAWAYDSEDRTAVRLTEGAAKGQPEATADPARTASEVIALLRQSSSVAVDGTAEVAGRPAYELVLTPNPTERTLLREVRIAVDAEKRIPLQLTVLANGSADPAFQLGFTALTFGPQDPALFAFTPPPGTTVEDAPQHSGEKPQLPAGTEPTVVGEGWDTVVVVQQPAGQPQQQGRPGGPELAQLGTPVSGPWGSGRLITTAVASAIITDDGRVAAGAVPEQVLTDALAR